jgi:hypothetical protein
VSKTQRSGTRSRRYKRIRRDTVSFTLGWVVIFVQLLGDPARVNLAFLILAGGLVGVPFAAPAIAAIRGTVAAPLTESSISPPSSPSSLSSGGESGGTADDPS